MNYKLLPLSIFLLLSILIIRTTMAGDIKGKIRLKGSVRSAGILVYIEHVDSTFTPPQKHAVMDQKDLMFVPEVLPILAGTTVDFLNSDNVLHNVFTPSKCAGSFNLGTWPKDKIRSHIFTKAGCFATILCDVHPDMQAWIAVLQNPYFAQTNKSGDYEIKNVPPGKYNLIVWEPFYETKTLHVEIKKTGVSELNLILKRKSQ